MAKRPITTIVSLTAVVVGLAIAGAIWLSAPNPVDAESLPAHVANLQNGKILYTAGGCISCHKPSAASIKTGANVDLPSGGAPLSTPLGPVFAPNITPDKATGIGGWTQAMFVSAMQRGVSPDGRHYIPAFPYTSYARMKVADILDIWAYINSLTPVNSLKHDDNLMLEPVLRRGIGLWKLAAISAPIEFDASKSAEWNRGAYLVNGPGHCGECHTPRNVLMISQSSNALDGGPHPDGHGTVPSLHRLIERKVFSDVEDLATALREGEEGGYEHMSSGGMGEVQTNLSRLPEAEVMAIATYLSTLP
jgi:mono/diheme cytochrome c family protein